MPLPTAYGTVPIGGALPEAYIDPFIPISTKDGANNLPTGYGVLIPAVSMTAAASGSSGITVADDDDIDFGTGNFTIHWEGALPDWASSTTRRLWYKYQTLDNRVTATVNSTNQLNLFCRIGAVTVVDESSSAAASTILQAGQNAKLTYVCTRETASADGSVAFYINGALFDTQTIPAAATVSISNTGQGNISCSGTDGTGRLASTTRAFYLYNRALSAAEVLSLCNNGVDAADAGGSNTNKFTGDSANFEGGTTGGWSPNTGNGATSVAVNIVLPISGTYDLIVISNGLVNSGAAINIGAIVSGEKYRLVFDYKGATSNAWSVIFRNNANPSSGSVWASTLTGGTNWQPSTPGQLVYEFTAQLTTASARVHIANSSADTIQLDNFLLVNLGNTLALAPQGLSASGLTWTDSSGNGNNGTLPAAGATKVTIRK